MTTKEKIQEHYELHKDNISEAILHEHGFEMIAADDILNWLHIEESEYKTFTFESASFVIALSDGKTIVEVCASPEMITIEEDKTNPLFK